mmetsp:Transcript_37769/g.150601  ORF Transcript_37769/g.150601 Transcript_37769/m.150601 type:complete len:354 (-) Transcript_37769:2540-3601(-)|eukprot:CAMPEP_0113966190 /NCGR_PEP_ID=MMETSP0011_2-20120614/8190_1 /TAXON_ID=101924 /ORGANISM="Rhodosorus marinus" /LENGTH=353 /DNA_ID=CAMNT_0000978841 /DNA_START=38 /DNA_END=1099 /DNA_ORIENTATION=+ /assembly_acc=CAM_ASM_000156
MSSKKYKNIKKLGEGAGGVVTQAEDVGTGRIVAVKKVRMGKAKDGISMEALREIKLLQEIKHPNVIELVDAFSSNTNVNLVFEYCLTDLDAVIRSREIFITEAEVKGCLLMILRGVEACHKHWTLHRDLKPNNILLGTDGNLKLADFGLARIHGSPNPRLTHIVVTRWYRAPELLFGARQYGTAIDMWAVGCVFAELMLRVPYLPGDSEIDQLVKIFHARGTPDDAIWPGMSSLPGYVKFSHVPAQDHRALFTAASEQALDLLNKFLVFDPLKRISAADALAHPYFTTGPPPSSAADLLKKFTKNKTPIVNADQKDKSNNASPFRTPGTACRKDDGSTPPSNQFATKRKLEFT